MNKKYMDVVVFHLNKGLHKEIKARAASKNITMRIWLTRAIMEYIKRENSNMTIK